MGFTRYWTTKGYDPEKFKLFVALAEKIIKFSDANDGTPLTDLEINDVTICFNGTDDDAHETFYVGVNDVGFSCCKTARKPYDKIVVAILFALSKYFPETEITSDGDNEDELGAKLFNQALESSYIN